MAVESIMTTHITTVDMDDPLKKIGDIFRQARFHHLLVLNDGKLIGIISDRDFLKEISPYVGTLSETTRDRATLDKRAHQIMTRNPVVVSKETPLRTAAQILLERQISCLPVIGPDKEILGIITWKDLLRALMNSQPSSDPTLSAKPSYVDR
ncbi:MAG: CBS domain-containing protein [Nitrospirae bacterium]|nr:MAG: CBS domain-containing protein [Nitrospirota bacterium]